MNILFFSGLSRRIARLGLLAGPKAGLSPSPGLGGWRPAWRFIYYSERCLVPFFQEGSCSIPSFRRMPESSH